MYGADASCQKGSNIHVQLSISRAFNVTANLYVMRPAAPKFCFFQQAMRLAGILPHSSGSLSLCFLK